MLPEHQAPETRLAKDRDLAPPPRPQPPERRPGDPVARGADGDIVVDIPHLKVDELVVDIAATVALDHLKVEAKGLDLGLFVKADVGALSSAASRGRASAPPDIEGRAHDHGERSRLRRMLATDDGHDGRSAADDGTSTGRRALQLAKGGGKAASLTAAGLAGGALLESRLHRAPALPRALRGHAPGVAQRAGEALLESARDTGLKLPGPLRRRRSGAAGVLDRVREQLH